MTSIQKAWQGTATATGVVPLTQLGQPAHLRPSATPGGSAAGNDQRLDDVNHAFVLDTPLKTLHVRFLGSNGSVTFQGCDGDPSVAANWYAIGSAITASGAATDNNTRRFVRANLTNAGDAGVSVHLAASSS